MEKKRIIQIRHITASDKCICEKEFKVFWKFLHLLITYRFGFGTEV